VTIAIEIAHRNVDRLHTNGETSRSAETAVPSPNAIETLFELKLAVATSGFPSPLKSPTLRE